MTHCETVDIRDSVAFHPKILLRQVNCFWIVQAGGVVELANSGTTDDKIAAQEVSSSSRCFLRQRQFLKSQPPPRPLNYFFGFASTFSSTASS